MHKGVDEASGPTRGPTRKTRRAGQAFMARGEPRHARDGERTVPVVRDSFFGSRMRAARTRRKRRGSRT